MLRMGAEVMMLRILSCIPHEFANLRLRLATASCDALRALGSVSQLNEKKSHLASIELLLLSIRESYSQRLIARAA